MHLGPFQYSLFCLHFNFISFWYIQCILLPGYGSFHLNNHFNSVAVKFILQRFHLILWFRIFLNQMQYFTVYLTFKLFFVKIREKDDHIASRFTRTKYFILTKNSPSLLQNSFQIISSLYLAVCRHPQLILSISDHLLSPKNFIFSLYANLTFSEHSS